MADIIIIGLLAIVVFLLMRILRVQQSTHAGLNFQEHIRRQFSAQGSPTEDEDAE